MKLKKIGIVVGIIASGLIIFWLIGEIFSLFIPTLIPRYSNTVYPIILFIVEPIKYIFVGIFISWAIGKNGKLFAVATTSVLALAAGTISIRMIPKALSWLYLLQPICATILWLLMAFIGAHMGQIIRGKRRKEAEADI